GITRGEGWFATEGMVLNRSEASRSADGTHLAGELHNRKPSHFTVIGLPPDSPLVNFDLIAGRKLQTGDSDAVVVNQTLAGRSAEIKVGQRIYFQIESDVSSWLVVGIARESFSPAVAYVPLSYFDKFHPGVVNSLRLKLSQSDNPELLD